MRGTPRILLDRSLHRTWLFQSTELRWVVQNFWRPRLYRWFYEYKKLTAIVLPFLKQCESVQNPDAAETARRRTLADVRSPLSAEFLKTYLYPMIAAVWSAEDPSKAAACPILSFLRNHRLLWPQAGALLWLTPRHGSRDYVERLSAHIVAKGARIVTGASVKNIDGATKTITLEKSKKVTKKDNNNKSDVATAVEDEQLGYDSVILCCHATDSQKLQGLSTVQQKWLAHFRTSLNEVCLWSGQEAAAAHMPSNKADWASWNTPTVGPIVGGGNGALDRCKVTYWLSRLQDTRNPHVFVTLNHDHDTEHKTGPPRVRFNLAHPIMDEMCYRGQRSQDTAQGVDGVYFAGAWLRCGFHEDGAVSGLLATRRALRRADIPVEFVTEQVGSTPPVPVIGFAEHAAAASDPSSSSNKTRFVEKQFFHRWDAREPPTGFDRGDFALPYKDVSPIEAEPLDTTLRKRFLEKVGFWPAGRIEVIGHLRYLGCGFNSFVLYIARGDRFSGVGNEPSAIMIEVHNIPWGEAVLYGFAVNTDGSETKVTLPKTMHVSPFHAPPTKEDPFFYDFTAKGFEHVGAPGSVSIALRKGDSADVLYSATLRVQAHGEGQNAHDVKYGAWRAVLKIYARAFTAAVKQGRVIVDYSGVYKPTYANDEAGYLILPHHAEAVSALLLLFPAVFNSQSLDSFSSLAVCLGAVGTAAAGAAFHAGYALNPIYLVGLLVSSAVYLLASLWTYNISAIAPLAVLLLTLRARLNAPSPSSAANQQLRSHWTGSVYCALGSVASIPVLPPAVQTAAYTAHALNLICHANKFNARALLAVVLTTYFALFANAGNVATAAAVISGYAIHRAAVTFSTTAPVGLAGRKNQQPAAAAKSSLSSAVFDIYAFVILCILSFSVAVAEPTVLLSLSKYAIVAELGTLITFATWNTSATSRSMPMLLATLTSLAMPVAASSAALLKTVMNGSLFWHLQPTCQPVESTSSSNGFILPLRGDIPNVTQLTAQSCASPLLFFADVMMLLSTACFMAYFLRDAATAVASFFSARVLPQAVANGTGVEFYSHEEYTEIKNSKFATDGSSVKTLVHAQPRDTPHVVLRSGINKTNFLVRLIAFNELEMGESYCRNEWTAVVPAGYADKSFTDADRVYLVLKHMAKMSCGPQTPVATFLLDAVRYVNPYLWKRRANFKKGFDLETRESRGASITLHYDDESAVIRSFLDSTRLYTSALFRNPVTGVKLTSLHEAQLAKVNRVLDLAQCRAGSRLMDIGCGWGYLAFSAAARGAVSLGVCNCYDMIRNATKAHIEDAAQSAKIAAAGGKLHFQHSDYNDLPLATYPQVDIVTAVEMIEAVPRAEYQNFAKACWRSLVPGGRMVMQAIHARPYNNVVAMKQKPDIMGTFVTTHIFPGQQLPNLDWLFLEFDKAGFERVYVESSSHDYERTLQEWAANLEAKYAACGDSEFSEAVMKKYRYYLAFCRACFEIEMLDLARIVWVKK